MQDRSRPGVDDVRYQVVRLMRMLVQLCQTLDQVPEEVGAGRLACREGGAGAVRG